METSPDKKSVMLAVSSELAPALEQLLGKRYHLHKPNSVAQARAILDYSCVDLILCSVLFDDSRLLDLLQYCKSSSSLALIPFVGMRVKRGRLPIDSFRDLMMASSALGASAFVDLEQWEKTMGKDGACVQLQQLVESLLSSNPGQA